MSRYDYGMRGWRETTDPRYRGGRGRAGYGADFASPGPPRGPRVTARYNRDYIRESGERYPFNPMPYGGERRGQIGNEDAYRGQYVTRPGTRTHRGMPPAVPYDYRDFGPEFGGRYPDEL